MKNSEISNKKESSALRKMVNSGIAGGIIGGGLVLIDGLLGAEIFSSPIYPLAYGATNVMSSKNTKELGIMQGPLEGVVGFGSFAFFYHLGKTVGGYIKK